MAAVLSGNEPTRLGSYLTAALKKQLPGNDQGMGDGITESKECYSQDHPDILRL